MYLVCVDFSENNLLTEQLDVRSFYDLPVLNGTLIEHQLKNFADIIPDKTLLIDCNNKLDFALFETMSVDLNEIYKFLITLDENEMLFLFRNDVYFECDFLSLLKDLNKEVVVGLKDKRDFTIGLCICVKTLRKFYNKNISVRDLLIKAESVSDKCKQIDGYSKVLNNVKAYKTLLFDIINFKTTFRPPHIAEGIFTDTTIPQGDFSIIPPVFLGSRIQIESGTVIGPNTVIYNDTLIASDSSIKNSILFSDVFVSSNCFIEGSVCCKNASIKRNSAVFAGSVIGTDSLVGEDITVENNSIIRKNVKFDKCFKLTSSSKICYNFSDNFQGFSPEKASLLGSAIGRVFNKPKILIASDGSLNSLSIKLALLSGLVASGAKCFDIGTSFKTHIFFSSIFCECDYSVFISGKNYGTDIEVFNSENKKINKADCNNLLDFCNKRKFFYAKSEECKAIRQLNGMKRVYIREIVGLLESKISFVPSVECINPIILKTTEEIFKKLITKESTRKEIFIYFNENGSKMKVKIDGKTYSEKELRKLVFFTLKNNDNVIGNEPGVYSELWKCDCIFLLFTVLNILEKTGDNIEDLFLKLPNFYIYSKTFKNELYTGEITKKISKTGHINYVNESFNIELENGFVKIVNLADSSEKKIISASENMSLSEEICDAFYEFLDES